MKTKKIKLEHVEKRRKKPGDMVDMDLSIKIDLDPSAVSDKPELTDEGRTDGRTTNACATTVALLTKSRTARKKKKNEIDQHISTGVRES